MNRALIVHRAGPGVTVQDLGRSGYLAFGLSRGGAADRLALIEGATLLQQDVSNAALELAGMGGEFEASEEMRIALTGAPMKATIDGARAVWNASHILPKGARLSIGAAEVGSYGYLHLGGGLHLPEQLGAQSTHLAAGIGATVQAADRLPVGPDDLATTGLTLDRDTRFDGGTIRLVPSLQTEFFDAREITRFEATEFLRDNRANRMGVRIVPQGEGFHTEAGLTILSEVIVPGDVQITGDGTPFVLLSECQTTGGYPRIGSVLPTDLPRVAQAGRGAALRFRFVTLEQAVEAERREATR
ncbi:allophanate hydrolase [Shimia gijangensis]|uniref:Allophanate hydrolase n=1 Tax=Shimia gijangensis TaxID=1470563 RepID=A0A1M6CJ13_9RHOB|nr:allophanate hydrolase [Shimia gijangensis]